MRIISLAALTLVAAVAVAGCDTGSASSAPGDSSGTAAASASTPPTSSSGPKSLAPSPSAGLVLPHEDPALEGRLPDEFEGKKLFKLSVGPISSAGNEGAEPVKKLADEIGDGTGNFSLAFANDPTARDAGVFNYFALRIPGAPSAQLVEKYAALTVADTRGAESEQQTVAGKSVTHVTAPGNPIGDVWIYAIGDTLFGVQAHSPEQAAALLALLP
jgi:hypothetical protein